VHDEGKRGRQLTVQRGPVEPGGGAEGFQAGRDVGRGIRVHSATPALMSGVQGRQQIKYLRPAYFAHHQPVGAHSQGLPDEIPEGDLTDALLVGRAGLQPHYMRVAWPQLRRVLGEHDPFARIDEP
jgi:hypothetical protein